MNNLPKEDECNAHKRNKKIKKKKKQMVNNKRFSSCFPIRYYFSVCVCVCCCLFPAANIFKQIRCLRLLYLLHIEPVSLYWLRLCFLFFIWCRFFIQFELVCMQSFLFPLHSTCYSFLPSQSRNLWNSYINKATKKIVYGKVFLRVLTCWILLSVKCSPKERQKSTNMI